MKKILAVGIFIWLLFGTAVAYAGTLNANEQMVVNAAKGRFEVDGKMYVADSSYVKQLISYLSSDGLDLTEDQAEEAIAQMYANVQEGVAQGYLLPIEDQSNQEESSNDQTDIVTSVDANNDIVVSDRSSGERLIGQGDTVPSSDIMSTDTGSTTVADEDTIIKNTGFNLNRTFFIAVGAAMCMLICMIETLKSDFFAHNDE